MNKAELVAYLQTKGNERKAAMHKITCIQTDDWNNTDGSRSHMQNEAQRL